MKYKVISVYVSTGDEVIIPEAAMGITFKGIKDHPSSFKLIYLMPIALQEGKE